MKIINVIMVGLLVLLSIAAGVAKVTQVPQEMDFLQNFGFNAGQIMVFGSLQIVGGLLLVLPKTRLAGALLCALAFVVSAILIFMGGNFAFGLFSLLPVVLAGTIIYLSATGVPK